MRRLRYIAIVMLLAACASPASQSTTPPSECAAGFVAGPLGVGCVRDCSLLPFCSTDAECGDGFCTDVDGCHTCAATQPACDDPPMPIARACRSRTDCCGVSLCMGKGDIECGICEHTNHECDEQNPCPDGKVCNELPVTPCSCDGLRSQVCRDSCAVVPCAEGDVCMQDGSCRPLRCTEGFECETFERCDASSSSPHGCEALICRHDRDCPSGDVCVNGACADVLGTCSLGVP